MKDHSDWWSILNESFRAPEVKSQSKDLDPNNFRIAGVDLGDGFTSIAPRLGKTRIVQRGDRLNRAGTSLLRVSPIAKSGRRVSPILRLNCRI